MTVEHTSKCVGREKTERVKIFYWRRIVFAATLDTTAGGILQVFLLTINFCYNYYCQSPLLKIND